MRRVKGASPMPSEPYTSQQVVDICEEMAKRSDFRAWHNKNTERDDIRYRRTPINIPGISEKLEDQRSDAEAHIGLFNNYLDRARLNVSVLAKGDSDADIASAQRVEDIIVAMWQDWIRRRSNALYAADRRATDQQTAYGCGIRHLEFVPDIYEKLFRKQIKNADELKAAIGEGFVGNPLVLSAPDINATYWTDDLSRFCENGKKRLATMRSLAEDDAELLKYLPEAITSETIEENTSDENMVRTYHLETREFIYDVIEAGEPYMVEYRPNLIGRPWYTLTPGNLTSSRQVHEQFQPLVGEIYPIIQKLQIYGTLIASGALQTGRNQYQQVADGRSAQNFLDYMAKPDPAMPVQRIDSTQSKLPDAKPNHHWELMPVPDQTQLNAAYQQAMRELAQYGFPAVLDPSFPADATSGYDRAQEVENASNQLEPPLRNKTDSTYELFMLAADVLAALGLDVTIPVLHRAAGESLKKLHKETAKASDWKDFSLVVTFDAVPESLKFAKLSADRQEMMEKRLSPQTFFERHFENPQEEMERLDRADARAVGVQKAITDFGALLEQLTPGMAQQILAEAQVPLGPEEAESAKPSRPELGSFPGEGAPVVPPDQTQPSQTNPPASEPVSVG